MLTGEGVKVTTSNKVRAVAEITEPEPIAIIQKLLGMVMYTCKFLPNLSAITGPLRNL
ncbi:hypothetical protein HOLleu_01120 [Holothuria leucospilota]|uniref:Uncharacterized protein n=1 Tax=Holothuria leucospilota TaxID=206669 RepID=A0A9Q1CQE2_HOLLE|nr:hypothetical protein HOLleu_01120 [Holothuria leucospilota]